MKTLRKFVAIAPVFLINTVPLPKESMEYLFYVLVDTLTVLLGAQS